MKAVLKLLFPLLLLIVSKCTNAQFIISGSITDSSNHPLAYASVLVKSAAGVISSTASDSAGIYNITVKDTGMCFIEFSMINYLTNSQSLFIRANTMVTVKLAVDSISLSEVVVTGKKKLIERKADRFILNIENNVSAKGKKVSDLVKSSPGVFVNKNVIQMAGKDNVVVLMNDILVSLSGESLFNYINSLPADLISSIEIIPVPPAKYEAEGNYGLINIHTKKNIQPGIRANVNVDYYQTSYPGYSVLSDIYYLRSKMSVYASITRFFLPSKNSTNSLFYYPGTVLKNDNQRKWSNGNYNGQMLTEFKLTKKTVLGINYLFTLNDKSIIKDLYNRMDYLAQPLFGIDSSLISEGTTQKNSNQHNADFYINKKFGTKGHEMKIEAAFLYNSINSDRPFSSVKTDAAGNHLTLPEFLKSTGKQNDNIYTVKADFILPGKIGNLSTGGKLSFISNKSASQFLFLNNSVYRPDTTKANSFIYSENTQAIYINESRTIKKISFQAGLRAELTQTKGNSLVLQQITANKYLKVYPTLFISYAPDIKNNLSLSYGKRIDRPSFDLLDPFKWFLNKYFFSSGNPFITPSYTNTIELNYLMGTRTNFKFLYTSQANGFGKLVILNPPDVNFIKDTSLNYFDKRTYGINIYHDYNKLDWLETVFQFELLYQEYYAENSNFQSKNGYRGAFNIYNTAYLNKSKNIQGIVNILETPPGIYDYINQKNSFSLDIGCNLLVPAHRIEFDLYLSDLFRTAAPAFWYTTNGIKQYYNNYYDTRRLQISFKYNFGNHFIEREVRQLVNEDEKSRVK